MLRCSADFALPGSRRLRAILGTHPAPFPPPPALSEWFYRGKEHWADELEIAIDEVMMGDFNAEIEDGSQSEVANALIKVRPPLAPPLTYTQENA